MSYGNSIVKVDVRHGDFMLTCGTTVRFGDKWQVNYAKGLPIVHGSTSFVKGTNDGFIAVGHTEKEALTMASVALESHKMRVLGIESHLREAIHETE